MITLIDSMKGQPEFFIFSVHAAFAWEITRCILLKHYRIFSNFFLDLFGKYPSPEELQGVVYDRACDFHPFLIRLAEEGNEEASRYLQLFFMVDIFHVN